VTLRWLVCLLGCAACRGELKKPAVGELARTAKLARGTITLRQLMTGDLRAASSLGVTVPRTDSWQLAIRWLADDGAIVKAGDKVLEFDNSEFTAQLATKHLAVLEAQLALNAARDLAEIETATKTTELQQHQIALDKATLDASIPADLLSGRDAQDRQLAKKRAEVAVEKAQHDLTAQRDEAALELRIKQIAFDKARAAIEIAEKTIADLVLVAPRDGLFVVEEHPWLGRKIHMGDTVQPGMTVATLPDMSEPMEVHAELSDVDDGRVSVGLAGTCTLDAYPGDPIACTVKDLTPVARSKGESSLRRAFAVVLDLGKTDSARMRPGMSVKVELHLRTLPNVLVVPRSAIVPPEASAASAASAPSAAKGTAQSTAQSTSKTTAKVRMASGELRAVTLGACDAQVCAAVAGVVEGDAVLTGGLP
jgi:multidrug resistance efflux pump